MAESCVFVAHKAGGHRTLSSCHRTKRATLRAAEKISARGHYREVWVFDGKFQRFVDRESRLIKKARRKKGRR